MHMSLVNMSARGRPGLDLRWAAILDTWGVCRLTGDQACKAEIIR